MGAAIHSVRNVMFEFFFYKSDKCTLSLRYESSNAMLDFDCFGMIYGKCHI